MVYWLHFGFDLEQDDHVDGTSCDENEAWAEWTPTTGRRFRFDDIDRGWATRVTTGTGLPGVDDSLFQETAAASPPLDLMAAPRDALMLRDATVVTDQSGSTFWSGDASVRESRTGTPAAPVRRGTRESGAPWLPQKVQTSGVTIMTTANTTAVSGRPTRR